MADDPAALRTQQEALCARYGLQAVEPEEMVAVAMSTLRRMGMGMGMAMAPAPSRRATP